MNKKFTYEYVSSIFKNATCELLSEVYVNNSSKLKYKCSCGSIAQISLACFQNGQRCKKCRYEKSAKSMKLDFNFVKNFFTENGCELLEEEYKNARTNMKYKCSCGNVSFICFDSFKNGNRCRQCGNKKTADKQRFTQEEMENIFLAEGCFLIDVYQRSNIPMRYICVCGKEAKISYTNFNRGERCRDCGIAKRSGENHYEWRPDRDVLKKELLFRQRCYKLVKMVLNVTGRVKNKHTTELLGYDYKQLQEHITNHPNFNTVKSGNWHIDHIFPIKAFLDHGIEDLALINCLENLRPISMFENCSKNGKYDVAEFRSWLIKKGFNHDS